MGKALTMRERRKIVEIYLTNKYVKRLPRNANIHRIASRFLNGAPIVRKYVDIYLETGELLTCPSQIPLALQYFSIMFCVQVAAVYSSTPSARVSTSESHDARSFPPLSPWCLNFDPYFGDGHFE